jgi:predicted restriction endonuclease
VVSRRERKCEFCGYPRHVECCHIREIADFPNEATLGEVNAVDNLVLLCPNHHWELDHGFLARIDGKWRQK